MLTNRLAKLIIGGCSHARRRIRTDEDRPNRHHRARPAGRDRLLPRRPRDDVPVRSRPPDGVLRLRRHPPADRPAESPELDPPASIIYYAVDDIQTAAATLKSRGVSFMTEPHVIARLPHADLWMAAFRDSSQNILELMSERPRS